MAQVGLDDRLELRRLAGVSRSSRRASRSTVADVELLAAVVDRLRGLLLLRRSRRPLGLEPTGGVDGQHCLEPGPLLVGRGRKRLEEGEVVKQLGLFSRSCGSSWSRSLCSCATT